MRSHIVRLCPRYFPLGSYRHPARTSTSISSGRGQVWSRQLGNDTSHSPPSSSSGPLVFRIPPTSPHHLRKETQGAPSASNASLQRYRYIVSCSAFGQSTCQPDFRSNICRRWVKVPWYMVQLRWRRCQRRIQRGHYASRATNAGSEAHLRGAKKCGWRGARCFGRGITVSNHARWHFQRGHQGRLYFYFLRHQTNSLRKSDTWRRAF